MDGLTVLGLLVGFLAISIGQFFEGGDIQTLVNLPALLIVLGGTLGAVMVQTPITTFRRAFKVLPWIFSPPDLQFDYSRKMLVDMAKSARKQGLISIEQQLDKEPNPFIRKGLELIVVGVDKHTLRDALENEIGRTESINFRAAHVFESMGGYSPTIGILGAVLGLIEVMRNLSDPSQLGIGIAVAFVATIYGVGFANLVFIPIAKKLKSHVSRQVYYDEMLLEGLVAIASGESPYTLQIKLSNFGPDKNEKNKKK